MDKILYIYTIIKNIDMKNVIKIIALLIFINVSAQNRTTVEETSLTIQKHNYKESEIVNIVKLNTIDVKIIGDHNLNITIKKTDGPYRNRVRFYKKEVFDNGGKCLNYATVESEGLDYVWYWNQALQPGDYVIVLISVDLTTGKLEYKVKEFNSEIKKN